METHQWIILEIMGKSNLRNDLRIDNITRVLFGMSEILIRIANFAYQKV